MAAQMVDQQQEKKNPHLLDFNGAKKLYTKLQKYRLESQGTRELKVTDHLPLLITYSKPKSYGFWISLL